MTDNHYIQTNKYRLEIQESWEDRKIQMVLMSKVQNFEVDNFKEENFKIMYWVGTVPNEWMEGDDEKTRRVKRYRHLHVNLSMPPTICLENQAFLLLKDETLDGAPRPKYTKKVAQQTDILINKGVKYSMPLQGRQEIKVVLDYRNKCFHLYSLQRTPIRAGQALNADPSLFFPTFFKTLLEPVLGFDSDPILGNSVPIQVITPSDEELWEKWPGKLALFRHIFLTELITHMITRQFGRTKQKHTKHREGYSQMEYDDEELEVLRSWGYRMYQFRDNPIKWKKKKRKEGEEVDSLDEEEEEEAEQGNIEEEWLRREQKEGEEEGRMDQKKTRIQEMGLRLKKVIYKKKNKDICNFTFISGYEKSRINKMRYCLHQLTMETDHTQAMMDFIRLIFQVVPIRKLMGTPDKFLIQIKQKNEDKKDSQKKKKKELLSGFLERFRVKRDICSCLKEYTDENFFYPILNSGLRLFRNPYQLVYLRLPFSHIFWSIKFLYHRHKRAIFQHKQHKNKDRTIQLYRGSSINEEEAKQLGMNVGDYIEAEGFLSTSLLAQTANGFSINLDMTIHVPMRSLKGIFDNGFAHISKFQSFNDEEEVLINAFNMFKVLSFQKANKDSKTHVLELQYGGVKAVEEKVRKSEEVLDKEFVWKEGQREIQLIRYKLDVNQENMSKKWHTILSSRLKEEEKKHGERKKKLEARTKEEYQHAVTQLQQWDKQLLLNTQHQLSQIANIQNYGNLLFALNEWRKGCIYMRRRMKQVEAERAIEGIHWRNNHSLIELLQRYTGILQQFYHQIGRVKDSWAHQQKLLHIYKSISVAENDPSYYGLLYNMYIICNEMVGMKEEGDKYKEKLMGILEKHQLTNTTQYKYIKQHESRVKQEEKVLERKRAEEERKKRGEKETKAQKKQRQQQQQRRKSTLTSMKKQLQHIRLYTYGLYTYQYLQQLRNIILLLQVWGWWRSVIKQGNRYMQIRSHAPHVQSRNSTCDVLKMMLEGCVQVGARQELEVICERITSFIPHNIHQYKEYWLVQKCLQCCLVLQCWRPDISPLSQLMSSNIKCELLQAHVLRMMLYGYVLLLLSVSVVDKFLQWATTLNQSQSYTHTKHYKDLLQRIIQYNNEYKSSDKNVYDERKKEYYDVIMIKYAHELIKNGEVRWNVYRWEKRRGELIGWQHPFHPLYINMMMNTMRINESMGRGQVGMCILHSLQLKNSYYNLLNENNSKLHLSVVCVISKLHKNEYDFTTIPSLLQFLSTIKELWVVQMQMGIDVVKCISNTQHLREDHKQQKIPFIRGLQEDTKNGMIWGLQMGREEVKWMRGVGRRCNHHRQSTTIPTQRQTICLRMDLQEDQAGRKSPVKGEVVETTESGVSTYSTCAQMHIGMNFMLTMGDSAHYERISPAAKVFLQLQLLMKCSAEYVLDIPSVMRETIPYKGKKNLKKLRYLSRLHMRDQKVSRVDRCWNTLKQELNEQECVLLQYQHNAPRYEQVPEWYTKYWEEQKQVRQQKRQQYKAELEKRIEGNKQIQ